MKTFLRKHTPEPIWAALKSGKKAAKKLVLRAAKLEHRKGILFIGYAEGDLGLGHTFRNDLLAAAHTKLPFAIYPFSIGIEARRIGSFMPERYDKTHAYDVNIIQVAPDQMPEVLRSVDSRITYYTYNVLRTYWELPRAPKAWRQMLKEIDEIWAPTSFVANSFRHAFSGPINLMPTTVEVGDGPWKGRDQFGMEPGRFYFLFSFDYFSSPYRKNPLGALEAFQRAFPDKKENVGLIIKSIGNVDDYPNIKETIGNASAADPRIQIIHKSLPYNEMASLIHAADVYLSLHRSEGFGMGMAEALSFGRIVIGTNFSGNTDFLTEQTGFPVPYTLRPVEPYEYLWNTEPQVWAEPDLKEAARILRQVFEAPDLALKRAKAGQMLIRQKYGVGEVGRAMKERLITLGLLEK
jgi:glycosyltransferase involved in cell wall biosynthesis